MIDKDMTDQGVPGEIRPSMPILPSEPVAPSAIDISGMPGVASADDLTKSLPTSDQIVGGAMPVPEILASAEQQAAKEAVAQKELDSLKAQGQMPAEMGVAQFIRLSEVIKSEKSTPGEKIIELQNAKLPIGDMIKYLEADGRKEEALALKEEAERRGLDIQEKQDSEVSSTPEETIKTFEERLEEKDKELAEKGNLDEQEFRQSLDGFTDEEKDAKVIELRTLKTHIDPLRDKIKSLMASKGAKIIKYTFLTMIIAFLLTAFALLRVHTGVGGGGKGR